MNKTSQLGFLKKFLFFLTYCGVGALACVLAFLLVIQFLSPAFSKPSEPKKEQGAKEVIKEFVGSLKDVFTDTFSDKKEASEAEKSNNSKKLKQVEIPKEDLPSRATNTPNSQDNPSAVQKKREPEASLDSVKPLPPQPVANSTKSSQANQKAPQTPPVADSEKVAKPQEVKPLNRPAQASAPAKPNQGQNPVVKPTTQVQPQTPPSQKTLPTSSEGQRAPIESIVQTPEPAQNSKNKAENTSVEEFDPSQSISSEVSAEVQSYMAPFIYDSVKQKDPFEDPTRKEDQAGTVLLPQTPPEKYNLEEITLRGIIWDTKTPKALFELPNNEGFYTLIKGDKIGKNGVLFEIRESEVIVVETNSIGIGSQKKEERLIKVRRIDRVGIDKE